MSSSDHFRRFGRRGVSLAVSLRQGRHVSVARIVDLSLAGACLVGDVKLAPDDELELTIDAPSLWDPVSFVARVCWVDRRTLPVRCGVRFTPGPEFPARALRELLEA